MYYALKIIVTTILIVLISEVAKRSSLAGAILASIPLVSVYKGCDKNQRFVDQHLLAGHTITCTIYITATTTKTGNQFLSESFNIN